MRTPSGELQINKTILGLSQKGDAAPSSRARSMECLLQAGPWAVSSLGEAVNLALERSFTCAWLPGPPGVY